MCLHSSTIPQIPSIVLAKISKILQGIVRISKDVHVDLVRFSFREGVRKSVLFWTEKYFMHVLCSYICEAKREAGERPARTRHCNWKVLHHGVSRPLGQVPGRGCGATDP